MNKNKSSKGINNNDSTLKVMQSRISGKSAAKDHDKKGGGKKKRKEAEKAKKEKEVNENRGSSNTGCSKKEISDKRWQSMFEKLLRYREKTGHCRVPNRHAEDPTLGAWVATQRRFYKMKKAGDLTSPLTEERENKLDEIGFQWSAEITVPWTTRFIELLEFVVKNGHAQVPIGWEENVPLSNWVSTQRQEYKSIFKGRKSKSLNDERVRLLNSIGFIWKAQRGGPKRERTSAQGVVPEPGGRVDDGLPLSVVANNASSRRAMAQSLLRVFRRNEENQTRKDVDVSIATGPLADKCTGAMPLQVSKQRKLKIDNTNSDQRKLLGDSISQRGLETTAAATTTTTTNTDRAIMPLLGNSLGIASSALFGGQILPMRGTMLTNNLCSQQPQMLFGGSASGVGTSSTYDPMLSTLASLNENTAKMQLLQARAAYQQKLGVAASSAAATFGGFPASIRLPSASSLINTQALQGLSSLNNPTLGIVQAGTQQNLKPGHPAWPDHAKS